MYRDTLPEYKPVGELWKDEGERELAKATVQAFLDDECWNDKDRIRLAKAYKRYGTSMFIWKFYAVARCYIGGAKALSAHLKLRRSP